MGAEQSFPEDGSGGFSNCWKNHCSDLACMGTVESSTADRNYRTYTPHGWMKNPGRYEAELDRVAYDATPAYQKLQYRPCTLLPPDQVCNSSTYCGTPLFTGIATKHSYFYWKEEWNKNVTEYKYGHYPWGGNQSQIQLLPDIKIVEPPGKEWLDGKCPIPGTKNTGSTPFNHYKCRKCITDVCQAGEGIRYCDISDQWQYMCAQSFDLRDGATCERIGRVSGQAATVSVADALGRGGNADRYKGHLRDQDPRFRVTGTYWDGTGETTSRGHAECAYPRNAIENESQFLQFMDLLATGQLPNNEEFISPLMESYCFGIVDDPLGHECMPNHFSGTVSRCSRNFAIGNMRRSGDMCRAWLTNFAKVEIPNLYRTYENMVVAHCRSNPDLAECLCMNRNDDKMFQDVLRHGFSPGSAACWYMPCRQGMSHGMLLDQEILNVVKDNECTYELCVNVTSLVNSWVDNYGAQQTVGCTQTEGAETPAEGESSKPPSPTDTLADVDQAARDLADQAKDTIPWTTIGIVIGVLVIGGASLAFFLRSSGKKEKNN